MLVALVLALLPPVAGPVTGAFDYGPDPFARGQHRGADLRARPGTPVRAPCAGRVLAAGPVAGRGVVSLRCGRWRVSLLPVGDMRVASGHRVRRGEVVAAVAAGHRGGLHLGVRRERDRFAYVDPAALLGPVASPPAVPVVPARRPPVTAPRPPARPFRAAPPPPPASVPWPALAGLAAVLGGLGSGVVVRRRRTRRRVARSAAWNRASA